VENLVQGLLSAAAYLIALPIAHVIRALFATKTATQERQR
jgi:hypothetical protein